MYRNMKAILSSILLFALLLPLAMSTPGVDRTGSRVVAGGYFPVEDKSDPRVVKAVSYVVKELLLLLSSSSSSSSPTKAISSYSFSDRLGDGSNVEVKIAKAVQQVVAGMNYKFLLMLESSSGDCLGAFTVRVYDQFGQLSVTQWGNEVSCDEAKAALEESSNFGKPSDDFEH